MIKDAAGMLANQNFHDLINTNPLYHYLALVITRPPLLVHLTYHLYFCVLSITFTGAYISSIS